MRPRQSLLIAASLVVTVGMVSTIEVILLRRLGSSVSAGQILLFRTAVQLIHASAWVAWIGPSVLTSGRMRWHVLRGMMSIVSWSLYYFTVSALDLALFTTLNFSSQIFVVALAGPVLGERVTRTRVVAAVAGFVGIAIAVRIWDVQAINGAAMLVLLSAFVGSGITLVTRHLATTERVPAIMFYLGLITFLAAVPMAILTWKPIGWTEVATLCVTGSLGYLAMWLMIEAFRRAEASALAPFPYLRLILSIAAGSLLFGEPIHASTILGAVLIIGASLYLVTVETRRRRLRAAARAWRDSQR